MDRKRCCCCDKGYEKGTDLFTRLNIPMADLDDGTRPMDPTWTVTHPGSPTVFFDRGLAISHVVAPHWSLSFPDGRFLRVLIRNLGTIDATGVFLETGYVPGIPGIGIVYGEPEPHRNVAVPVVPAGHSVNVDVELSSEVGFGPVGTMFARVFDTYSLLHYPKRCHSWDAYVNPQTAYHCYVFLPHVLCASGPLVIPLPVINPGSEKLPVRTLVTDRDQEPCNVDFESIYPLPFRQEWFAPGGGNVPSRSILRTRSGITVPKPARNGLWPREDVAPRNIHNRFGFTKGKKKLSVALKQAEKEPFYLKTGIKHGNISSFLEFTLPPKANTELLLVIPPEEQPKIGEERVFQIHFQVDRVRPTECTVVLRGSEEEGEPADLREEKIVGPLAKVIGKHRPRRPSSRKKS
jgi:hypothetical protein